MPACLQYSVLFVCPELQHGLACGDTIGIKIRYSARAPVGSERIETEMRSASGVTDGKGKFIAGVVMITAGYSAEGKYSHFFLSQVPLKINTFTLRPGQYAIGWHRDDDMLVVSFYEASTGKLMGTVNAKRDTSARVESFRMTPPGDNPQMFIGRFAFGYHVIPN